MTVGVVVMLTALTAVLAGLDYPTQRPFGIGPDAMRVEQAQLARGLGVGHTDPRAFCGDVPMAPAP